MNTCSGFLGLLPRRLREGLGIPSLAKPLREPRMRFPTFLKRNKALCILPNLRKDDPPERELFHDARMLHATGKKQVK